MVTREIKFRAWNPKMNEMYNDITLEGLSHLRGHKMEGKEIGLKMIFDFDSLVWMQFTGIKDANKRDIYEGDIIKMDNQKYEVVFGKKTLGFGIHYKEKTNYGKVVDKFYRLNSSMKVIGDIYK